MQRAVIVWVVLIFCVSCGGEKIPKGVIPLKQMPAVLTDMHLADGQLASLPIDSARMRRDAYYNAVFQRYGIDSTTFRRSVEFYSSRPYLMNEFYGDIEKKLEALNLAEQQRVQKKYEVQRRMDSIRNARVTDSLRHIAQDSLDFKRKRYLLFLNAPDSLYGKPDPVTYKLLRERMLESVGLKRVIANSEQGHPMPPRNPSVAPKPSSTVPQKPRLRPFEKIK
ncbi:DUF4296 domain-containing protein [Parapedobacter indicus]|uniref:DUF4296 domain-containing protein n=1 Tax=Parapedobacter indicus TaxID=1477437 RepID=A0A1I3R929_9SPHI|nr:DUF4296 domain-containing protein [Parapedobacter indicus]PPL00387.1 uncharacterized protein DUF4296 [Parapedobacter indicus]SFJ42169.1 protein of unknown function [Parapedobacter indicus]